MLMIKDRDYRLAFILPETGQILAIAASEVAALPLIAISLGKRAVEQLTRSIQSTWNIQTIVLDVLPGSSVTCPCAVIEILTPNWRHADSGFRAVDPGDIDSSSLSDEERIHITAILDDDNTVSPLSRLGWIDEAKQWIQASVRGRVVRFSGALQQLQAGGNFALIRFATLEGCCYWLKATGSPNVHEFSITTTLAQRFPQFLPRFVASREDWNAWVMEGAGATIRECKNLSALEHTVFALSALQQQSILHTNVLLNAGCADWSVAVLQSSLEELIEYLDEAMENQLSAKAQPLDKTQLSSLRSALNDACLRIQDLEIPDALIHIDINPGNVLFDGTRSVFIDWSEAAIGNPLLTFEHLAAHLAREGVETEAWLPILRAQYRKQWLDLLPEATVDRAFALTPLLAVATYLYGRGDWLRSPRRHDCGFQAHARSLARHMHRAALAPEFMEVPCR
jgi:thiamine kinase-like enzyme